jgi:adenylate kinase
MPKPIPSLLLLGPTGSGKTPLGDYLEKKGLSGRRCLHFDFGKNLRLVDLRPSRVPWLSSAEIKFIRNVLYFGALLENRQFPIAKKIFRQFLIKNNFKKGNLVILNGLPRHAGQAKDMEEMVEIGGIIYLSCQPPLIVKRIKLDTGGDRKRRTDDSLKEIQNKLIVFEERTKPLLEYYRNKNIPVLEFVIKMGTTAAEIWNKLQAKSF